MGLRELLTPLPDRETKALVVHLLRACGGAISLDSHDISDGSIDKVELVWTEYQDPWRVTLKVVEPEDRKDPEWRDITFGTVDRDIQEYVRKNYAGLALGQRTAIEETLQKKRNEGRLGW